MCVWRGRWRWSPRGSRVCRPSHAWLKCGSRAVWDSHGAWDTRGGEWCTSPLCVTVSKQTLPSSPAGDVVNCWLSSGWGKALINGFVVSLWVMQLKEFFRKGMTLSFNSTSKQDEISLPDLLFPLPSSPPRLLFCNQSFESLIQLSARCSPTSSGVTS